MRTAAYTTQLAPAGLRLASELLVVTLVLGRQDGRERVRVPAVWGRDVGPSVLPGCELRVQFFATLVAGVDGLAEHHWLHACDGGSGDAVLLTEHHAWRPIG